MTRCFYAFAHRYGIQWQDSDGDDIGTLYWFASRRERDAWVNQGPDYSTSPWARETWSAKRARKHCIAVGTEPVRTQ